MPVTPSVKSGSQNVSSFVMRIGSHPAVFGVAVFLAVGALVFFLAVVPLTRALQGGGTASLDDAKARLETARAGFDSGSKVIDRVAGIPVRDRALIAYALPVAEDGPGISVQMNAIAAASGVELNGHRYFQAAGGGRCPGIAGAGRRTQAGERRSDRKQGRL